MFERFTARARRCLVLAQEEARAMQHNFLGTEHILLGILAEGEGVGARVLVDLGVGLEACRAAVLEAIPTGATVDATGKAPFTPRAKKVLELSLREALALGHNYIGTEHLLLGLIREGDGVAAHVLANLGVELDAARAKVLDRLGAIIGGPDPSRPAKATRGGQEAIEAAAELSRGRPMGSHHVLLGILAVGDSLGAKVLESFGLTREAAEARIAEMGTTGTSDEVKRVGRRRAVKLAPGIELTVDEDQLDQAGQSLATSLDLSSDELTSIIELLRDHLERQLGEAADHPPDDDDDPSRGRPPTG